ncbi:MAG: alpha-2-macroglobulin, partial [Flavobacteriales bacterium]|nr:alpha-2-macroglobulin [Flavobacteriales bacterium]
WIKLSGSQQKIEIPITEEHRGNFVVHFSFVKHGRNFNFTDAVYVPYTNKMLDVKFETFRNKLLPGQNEEWKIKISDKKGDKVAAEMLATMYDASLDAFRPNYFLLDILNYYYSTIYWQGNNSFAPMSSSMISENWNKLINFPYQEYDQLNWFGYYFSRNYRYGYLAKNSAGRGLENDFDGVLEESSGDKFAEFAEAEIAMDATTVATGASVSQQSVTKSTGKLAANREQSNLKDEEQKDARDNNFGEVKARSNFNETAFFYPHLTTNEAGEIIISFTIPESLTKWKFMGLAHTKDLKSGMLTEEIITQKELMVYPNAPRFFREGDKMTFSTKIVNLSDTTIENGAARIFFYDALTMKDVTAFILKDNAENPFKVEKAKSTMVEWEIAIPEGYSAITYKVVAKSGDFSDGEEKVLPVLTNRMLVTESMPLPIRGNQSKTFTFEKLVNNKSTTLKHDKLTLEFTSNPAWYAVQALPYLIEYPYECAEQTFSRFYANSIASHVANSNPKIKNVFDSWKSSSPESFLSNLEKNQELKSAILEETPWVLNAQNESERKKRVGLLFDLNKMANEQQRALKKLQELQVGNGGWTWFKGMPESRYITQYIVTGLGRLKHMGVSDIKNDNKTWSMTLAAVQYLDNRIKEDYDYLKKYKVDLDKNNISQDQIMYLYARSYFINDLEISTRNKEAYQYYFNQAKKYWLSNSRYMQGMIAVAMN